MAVLDFIETEMSESRCSTQLMRLQGQKCRMKENLYREFTKFGGPQRQVENVLRILMEQGKQEGTIPVKMPETFVTMVLMAGFMSYFVYLLQGLETEGGSERADERIFTEKYSAGFQQQRRTEIRERGLAVVGFPLSWYERFYFLYTNAGRPVCTCGYLNRSLNEGKGINDEIIAYV